MKKGQIRKRYILVIILLVLFLIPFVILLFRNKTVEIADSLGYTGGVDLDSVKDNLNTLEGVSITLSSVTKDGFSCTFSNMTDDNYIYGDSYTIYQIDENGQWTRLEYIIPNAAFSSVGYVLKKGEKADKTYSWAWLYGSLPKGRYLFIVDVFPDGDYHETSYLAQEFEIP